MFAPQSKSQLSILAGVLLASCAGFAYADVTIDEQTSLNLAFIKMHITHSEAISGDKKREDSQSRCEGFMSMFCPKAGHGEIVRLDRSMTYDLEPAKKRYRETPFPTPAERKEMQSRMEQAMQKMKQCAAQQPQAQPQAVDTSKCQMSPAKLDVKNLGAAGQILGHDVHHTTMTMTSTCTNAQTGDACDMQFGFDSWLTDDKIAGLEDRDAFTKAYLNKLGLTGAEAASMARQMQQFLAPYADQLKELQKKSSDLKGHPLRTTFRVSYGGAKCAAAKNAGSGTGSSAGGVGGATAGDVTDAVANSTAEVAAAKAADGSVGGTIASRTLSSVGGKLLSGLFKKKKAEGEETAAAKTPAAEDAATAAVPAGMLTVLSMNIETTGITPGSVPQDKFEIPAGWQKIEPPAKGKEEEFTCPKSGGKDD
ncbi:MAG: hypothetical protein JSS24_13315 [Proteobacteria bacterium]|nr:hypothetical protein [Pseudomonadota bacterium]